MIITDFESSQRQNFDDFFSRSDLTDLSDNNATKYEFDTLVKFIDRKMEKLYILDYGCGDGRFGLKLAKKFPDIKVIGFDLSKVAVEKANSTAKKLKINNFIAVSQLNNYNNFDVILCVNVFHHVENLDSVLKTQFNLLKAGGS